MSGQPEHAAPFTIKRITKVTDKFAAICHIYEGEYFQNLCRIENPDGTFNVSENCLAKLPNYRYFDPDGGQYSAPNGSAGSSLAPYRGQNSALAVYEPGQSDMPPFRMFVTHYWLPIILIILGIFVLSLLFVNFVITPLFRRRSSRNRRDMVDEDEDGNLSIGKIKFHPSHVLGTGSKGTYVYRGLFEGSQECAIKRIVAQTITFADREVEFLRSLQNPNLVRYLATENDPQFIFIALELADCTLRSLVDLNKYEEFCLSKEEICRQAAQGLRYLHELDIVHRDLKPENILVSLPKRPNNARYIMITDFGLSKQLTSMETYHSSSVMRYFDGTQGWMPPEIIKAKEENKNLLPSKSADIFSLGCVFYYIIFDGKHPFGDAPKEREDNIKLDRSEIDHFDLVPNNDKSAKQISSELRVMGNDLISAMIKHDASERPPINSILKYPLFWTKKESLQFLSDVSDRLDKDQDGLKKRIEWGRKRVFGFGWKDCLSATLRGDLDNPLSKHRSYNDRKLEDLLRVIRNKNNHYNDCSPELKLDFGSPPDEYFTYFSSRFPELLVHVYKAMQAQKGESKFHDYYEQGEAYVFPTNNCI